MTQEIKEFTTKFDPRDPLILDKIAYSYQKKIVGETDIIKFLVCCYVSKDLPRIYRLHNIIISQSSAGKSSLVRTVAEPFSKYVVDYTNFTSAFLKRQEGSMDGKILLLEQMEKTNEKHEASMLDLKFLMSEGKLKVGVVEKDDKGKNKPITLEVSGIPVFVSTSTNMRIDPESLNRTFLTQVDESTEQTQRIISHHLDNFSSLKINNQWGEELAHLTALVEKYRELAWQVRDIVLPFAEKLKGKIPCENLTIRRDLPKILGLTAVIAFVHASNRYRIQYPGGTDFLVGSFGETEKRFQYTIIAEPEDFKEALVIAGAAIKQTLNKVNEVSMNLYARILEMYDNKTYNSTPDQSGKPEGLTVKEVAEKMVKSENRTRELMNQLEQAGYLNRDRTSKEHKFIPTGKKFSDLDIEELTFTKEEFEDWKNREIARHGHTLTVIEPSCHVEESKDVTK
ncbi:MAG: DNA primase [Nitrosopumilaceae archaeon]